MNEHDRDPEVAGALRSVRTPEHRPGFWDDLDAAMDGDADVVALPRRNNLRWLSAAAVILVVAVGALVVSRAGVESQRVQTNDDRATTTEVTTSTGPSPSTGVSTPDGAVREWIDALGRGDIDRAVALTGPRTERYMTSLGATLRGYLTEAQEGYGAWAASPDLNTTEIELPINREAITIVVVTGTWRGEGDTEFRTDALPVVNSGNGWRVEPSAFRSDTGGRLEVDVVGSDVTARAAGAGQFYFSLDDSAVLSTGAEKGKARFGLGDLADRTHLLVVAYVDGDTVTAYANRIRP